MAGFGCLLFPWLHSAHVRLFSAKGENSSQGHCSRSAARALQNSTITNEKKKKIKQGMCLCMYGWDRCRGSLLVLQQVRGASARCSLAGALTATKQTNTNKA